MCEQTREAMITRYGWKLYSAAMKIEGAKKLGKLVEWKNMGEFIESNQRKMKIYGRALCRLLYQ